MPRCRSASVAIEERREHGVPRLRE
jgi:hypothetical protein